MDLMCYNPFKREAKNAVNILQILFKRGANSREAAKERLKFVLMQDRSTLPSDLLDLLKMELLKVVSKHVRVEKEGFEVSISRLKNQNRLMVNVPFRTSKRRFRKLAVGAD